MDFDKIAEKFNVNIRVFEDFSRNGTRAWQLLVGQDKILEDRKTMDIGNYRDHKNQTSHCYYIKDIEQLIEKWECKKCRYRAIKRQNLKRLLDNKNENKCTGGQTKVICKGQSTSEILSKWKQTFYGSSRRKCSKKACLWIESESLKIGKHIHHALCGHGGERCIKIDSREHFVDGYKPTTNTVYKFYGCY